ncbi:hypothetical protein KKP90_04535, partial [Methanothermococcus sp. SCGC AD-155-E23]|nr:hypothetical protein [Methanothermococcus sp. SCGC AD-155-E23]
KRPKLKIPIRSLSNAKFDKEKGTFVLLGKEKERTLTVNQAKIFAQTVKMMEFAIPEFVQAMLLDELSTKIYEECKKIFPLKKVEIYKSEVLEFGKPLETPEEKGEE